MVTVANGALIKLRRGTQSNVDAYTPYAGEMIWATDTKRLYIGDGKTKGGHPWLTGDTRGTALEESNYYGTDKYGNKGFFNFPYEFNVNANKITIGGSATTETEFGYIKVIEMDDAVDSDAYILIDYVPTWNRNKNLNIRITYSMKGGDYYTHSGGTVLQYKAKVDYSYWVLKDGYNVDDTSPTDTATQYIQCIEKDNYNVIDNITFQDIYVDASNIDNETKQIIIKLSRDGDHADDNYTGALQIINVSLFQIIGGRDYGYFFGGVNANDANCTHTSTIDRMVFPMNYGTSIAIGNLSGTRRSSVACNSSENGYCIGGGFHIPDDAHFTPATSTVPVSTIDILNFPFDDGTLEGQSTLTETRMDGAGCNSSTYGYVIGGRIDAASTLTTDIEKIQLSSPTSTTAQVTGSLSAGRMLNDGFNSSIKGYSCGGYTGSVIHSREIYSITFPFDSGETTVSGYLNMENVFGNYDGTSDTGTCNSNENGYCIGGVHLDNISKFNFANEGNTITLGNLHASRSKMVGCNSSTYGFGMGGGYYAGSFTMYSYIDRLDFKWDNLDSVVIGNLSSTKLNDGSATDGTDFTKILI